MDPLQILEVFVRQGGLAVVALVMFYHYRKDIMEQRDAAKDTVDRLMKVVEDNTSAMRSLESHIERVSVCPMLEYRRFAGGTTIPMPDPVD